MGKWDHRPWRRFFRRRRSPVRPPTFYDINAPLPEYWQDGIPLWEKKYCTIVGLVPRQKIVDSKMFVYCHSNVFDWNDSAAEEAFQNAKSHYWAKINSLPCDISLPDPDTYINQIDWSPYIDPDLIKEIDGAFFIVPDEEQENAMKNKRTKTSLNDENPWECTDTPLSTALENNEVQGWNQGNSGDVDNTDNPWECSITCGNGGLTDNAWEGGPVKSWGWNEEKGHNNQCKDWNSGNSQDKGWGKARDSSWCQQQSNNLANFGNSSWHCKSSQQNVTPMKTGWRNRGANVSGWKQQEKAGVSRRNYGGGWTAQNKGNQWNQGNQWREGSHRHTLGYNGSQFQRDGCQTGHYWGKERSKKRDFFP
ncbi:hypothetical protein GLYMA_11G149400v4 [Glycine max]|uniref:Uncharacterized protein n=1 Tax=Glycine max TaxID=3847 RepID=K7LQH7_SOYBN|nr:bifunctional endo-1,4-beta-xylanase XylA [Glycine max]KRH29960.1 hypothetical protein GLYMA_11G149400v4 [Glycine max]|eukprot:XP_006591151.1 uncharacterized protein LOC102664732 [Glycine max]